ncbi:6237_t:CDS:1, partial [Cetraspora pellucida]
MPSGGIEPPTSSLQDWRNATMLRRQHQYVRSHMTSIKFFYINGLTPKRKRYKLGLLRAPSHFI